MSTIEDDNWDDDEDWCDDDQDDEDDEDQDMADCPECKKSVYLDANNCPYCGHWFLEEEKAAMSRQAHGDSANWRSLIILSGLIALISAWAIWILSIVR